MAATRIALAGIAALKSFVTVPVAPAVARSAE